MTLREEMPPKEQPVSFTTVRVMENDWLAQQVANFVSAGGKIEIIPSGVGKDTVPFNKGADNQKQAEIQEGFANQKKISLTVKKEICEAENKARKKAKKIALIPHEKRARSGNMNIHEVASGGHVVTIKSMHIGTYQDRLTAIVARDIEREKMGLPKAEY